MYSPFVSPAQAAVEFINFKDHQEQLRTWINTFLGETFSEASEQLDQDSILQRREHYAHPCPDGVLVLTAACDVQKDRLEVLITGHGKARREVVH